MHNLIKLILLSFLFPLSANCQTKSGQIHLHYDLHQQFKYRYRDINILGTTNVSLPVKDAFCNINNGHKKSFYIKGTDADKDKISRNRLQAPGDFNIEIPIATEELIPGLNEMAICIEDALNEEHRFKMDFTWDPSPVDLPLDLVDLSDFESVQQIGQVVDGNFIIDHDRNVIRAKAPVGKDVLLLLGSPYGSQEAFYKVRFTSLGGAFIGLSDFFAGHEKACADIGIKPGWSTSGLATVRGTDESACAWLAWGDLLDSPKKWVIQTTPPAKFHIETGKTYYVRHQVIFKNNINTCRFRIWSVYEKEPDDWLCIENDKSVPDNMIKFSEGIFGLFQYEGQPTEWFDIHLRLIESKD